MYPDVVPLVQGYLATMHEHPRAIRSKICQSNPVIFQMSCLSLSDVTDSACSLLRLLPAKFLKAVNLSDA